MHGFIIRFDHNRPAYGAVGRNLKHSFVAGAPLQDWPYDVGNHVSCTFDGYPVPNPDILAVDILFIVQRRVL